MYVLWRDEATPVEAWCDALLAAGSATLPAAGALGVQVNVADGAVAAAVLRIVEIEPQMEAVVSVWVSLGPSQPEPRRASEPIIPAKRPDSAPGARGAPQA